MKLLREFHCQRNPMTGLKETVAIYNLKSPLVPNPSQAGNGLRELLIFSSLFLIFPNAQYRCDKE